MNPMVRNCGIRSQTRTYYNTLYWVPGPDILIICCLHGGEGLQRKFCQFCSCTVVGSDHIVHSGVWRQCSSHVERQNNGVILCHLWYLFLCSASRYPGIRVCSQGSAATETEAHEPSQGASCHSDSVFVEMLRGR